MTQTQAELQISVNAMARSFPQPNSKDSLRSVELLERMANFYKSKAPQSKDGGALFNSFDGALIYAIEIILQHKRLTRQIRDLAEVDDETGTSS